MSGEAEPERAAGRRSRRAWAALWIALVSVVVVAAGAALVLGLPRDPGGLPRWQDLDRRWGTYLPERSWGTPRESVRGDGWAVDWEDAISTEYRFTDDGIAGLTTEDGEFRVGWAFWDGAEPHLTERFDGLPNPVGPHGEDITDLRVFHEHSPTHAYARMTVRYPAREPRFDIELEMAKVDSRLIVLRATATNTGTAPATLHVVLKGWMEEGRSVERHEDGLRLDGGSVDTVIVGGEPDGWMIDWRKDALDVGLRQRGRLPDTDDAGHHGALGWRLDLAPGEEASIQAAIEEAADEHAGERASATLPHVDERVAARRAETEALFRGEVAAHEPLYRQALMSLLWSETEYRWDGTGGEGWTGRVAADDLLLMPDRWEFPWVASWDTAFHAVTASRIDPGLAADELRFLLSDRWQQPDGHIPCAEWVMELECPPLLAWAAWRVHEAGAGIGFLREVYPALQRHYDFWRSELEVGETGLFGGGLLGMDNLPRGPTGSIQADGSGWMAMFARDLARIAVAVGDDAAGARYDADRTAIAAAVNATLWHADLGFYTDVAPDGEPIAIRSYSGLVPLIAGIVPADRAATMLSVLRDEQALLGPAGIRSLDASSAAYIAGHAGGHVNSNWRGPVWVPINLLLVEALRDVDPALAEEVRRRVVGAVEREWEESGRFWEYYDGDTGDGLGADAQTGWTAGVADLIAEGWPAP